MRALPLLVRQLLLLLLLLLLLQLVLRLLLLPGVVPNDPSAEKKMKNKFVGVNIRLTFQPALTFAKHSILTLRNSHNNENETKRPYTCRFLEHIVASAPMSLSLHTAIPITHGSHFHQHTGKDPSRGGK